VSAERLEDLGPRCVAAARAVGARLDAKAAA
jgi:hypothetical protein